MNIPIRNVYTRNYFPLAQVDKGLGLERGSRVLDIYLTFFKTMNCFSKWLYRLSIPINSTWKSQSFLTLFNLEYTDNCVVFPQEPWITFTFYLAFKTLSTLEEILRELVFVTVNGIH